MLIRRRFYRAHDFILLLFFWIVFSVTLRPSSPGTLVFRCFIAYFCSAPAFQGREHPNFGRAFPNLTHF